MSLLQTRYGRLCHHIALNLLGSREDAEERVNDTCLAVWNTIPPNRPASLISYVGKVTRNIAVSYLRKRESKGRKCEGIVLIDELAECLPDTDTLSLCLVTRTVFAAVPSLRRMLNLPFLSKSERQNTVPEGWTGIYTIEDLDNVRHDLDGQYILMNEIRETLI